MKNIIFLFLALLNIQSFAQKELNQNIRGIVKDSDTELPLSGVNVIILNSKPQIGISTNIDGEFVLPKLKLATYNLKFSHIGYYDVFVNNIYLTSSKEIVLDIKMKDKIITSSTVAVTRENNKNNRNEMVAVSVNTISNTVKNHIAGGISDPSRIVLSYAGIKNQGDLNNGFSIRGNKPTNMLWSIEGLEIQDPNHFTIGGSFGGSYINGAVSSVSNSLLKNINLYTGSFPAEYGNAISGVMDLSLRNGNDKTFEYNLNVGMLGIEATAEGPIEIGGSFLVTFRYSTLNLVSDLGFNINNSKIGYRDLNYKINFPTKKFGTFTAFGIAGWSDSKSLDLYKNNEHIWNTTYNNYVFGFSHNIKLSKIATIKNVLALSQVENKYHYWNQSFIDQRFHYNRKNTIYRYNITLLNKFNSKNKLQSGLKLNIPKLKFDKGVHSDSDFLVYSPFHNVHFENSTAYFQVFSQWKHRFNNKLSLNSGLHFLLFTYNMKYSFEPRVSLNWKINKRHNINFGTGIYSKIEFLPLYMAKINTNYSLSNLSNQVKDNLNKNIELSKSYHLSANYIYKPFKDFTLKIEPYFQYHFDVPERVNLSYIYKFDSTLFRKIIIDSFNYVNTTLNSSFEFYNSKLTNEGKGLNYGIEITIEKKFNKNYFFILTSSNYRSFYKTSIDKTWQPTLYDGLFSFTATGGKDFIIGKLKQSKISINARLLWSGGYIKPLDYRKTTFQRYKNYYKIDTKIAYTLNKKKITYTLTLDILNTTNHKNETSEYLQNAQGILPVLSLNFRFQK